MGIEPTTYRLQGGCSTTELIRRTPSAYAPHTLCGHARDEREEPQMKPDTKEHKLIFQVLHSVNRRIDELDRWVRLLLVTHMVTMGLVFMVAANCR